MQVLCQGTDTPREAFNLTQLHLSKFRIKFPVTASHRVVKKALEDAQIADKFKNSMWGRKLEAQAQVI